MITLSREWGARTEENALEYFLKSGRARCVCRNFRTRGGEVDLIFEESRDGGGIELVFVEVRARALGGWVSAEESVTFPKRIRLKRAIAEFLAQYRGPAKSLRIDLLAWDGRRWSHLRDIQLVAGKS